VTHDRETTWAGDTADLNDDAMAETDGGSAFRDLVADRRGVSDPPAFRNRQSGPSAMGRLTPVESETRQQTKTAA